MVLEITAPASWNSPKEANGDATMHPELLMAAHEGNSELLRNLLNNQDAVIAVDIIDSTTKEFGTPLHPMEVAATAIRLDSILHVVASSGDGAGFLESADVICNKERRLLDMRNENGDTPLQCAVRASNIGMVSHLIHLIQTGDNGETRLIEMLRNQNKHGETALHDALRLVDKKMVREMVKKLFQFGDDDVKGNDDIRRKADDAELARFESTNGTSPLYMAIMLGHDDIAKFLYQTAADKEGQRQLSYSGPDGQNVLHAAVLRSYDMTKSLLKWNKGLTTQRDKTMGSTPLHMATTWETKMSKRIIKLLMETDKSAAYLSDNTGSFPIHAAAERMYPHAARIILKRCPGCAVLQDGKGKTFLHIAVQKERSLVVLFACWRRKFAPILNIRDNEGNTALHLVAMVGNQWSFYFIIQNPHVQLDLVNRKGETPMDIAEKWKPQGIVYALDPRFRIYLLLKGVAAKNGIFRWDWFSKQPTVKNVYYEDYEKNISDSTQIIGIGSVLIVTVAFAAAFTLPGAFLGSEHYSNKGHCKLHGSGDMFCAGKATLAYDNFFRAFIIANTLALVCSALATMNVMFAGVATVDIRTRMCSFLISVFFLYCSAKSLAAAFLFGLFAVLPQDALIIAYISGAIGAPFLVLDVLWFISMLAIGEATLIKRLGWKTWFQTFDVQRIMLFILDIFRVLVMPLPHSKKTDPSDDQTKAVASELTGEKKEGDHK